RSARDALSSRLCRHYRHRATERSIHLSTPQPLQSGNCSFLSTSECSPAFLGPTLNADKFMRKQSRNGKLLIGFIVAGAVLLGVGSLSALARIFQAAAPIAFGLTTGNFQFVDTDETRSSEGQTASSQDSFSRSAPM